MAGTRFVAAEAYNKVVPAFADNHIIELAGKYNMALSVLHIEERSLQPVRHPVRSLKDCEHQSLLHCN